MQLARPRTRDVVQLARVVWDHASPRGAAKPEDVLYGVEQLAGEHAALYEAIWSKLNARQQMVLRALAVNTTADVGFDIAGTSGTAFVALATGAGASGTGSTLYPLNLSTGSLFPVGNVSGAAPLRGIAIAP